jgi:pyruvate/2-oxoglutarate dehydrogenase complex dihydrolipoamide dehydrogenase (E3) component
MARIEADICVIGAGSAGLSVAAGASQLGARTVLIERGAMGGDCLNTGCVPSKALIAAARAAHTWRHSAALGVAYERPRIDPAAVRAHVNGVIAAIAPMDSEERFTGLGVNVLRTEARFTGPDEVEAGGDRVRARRFVIATGSRAALPPIPGLADVPHFTNESIFELAETPEHLVVIGGGPIGIELAQAHLRLGARVTVLEAAKILPKDDPEMVDLLRVRLAAEGLVLREGVRIARVERRHGDGVDIEIEGGERLIGSHLLVAAGRQPNVEELDLAKAGVAFGPKGIEVDARLRTSNRRIFAMGDVTGGPQFTHVAGYHAGIVIRNALFRLPAKVDYAALPWVTYTDPELAHVGLTEAAARERHAGDIAILRSTYHENDRAQTERETMGVAKIVTRKNGRILGATILGAQAGELVQLWVLAIGQKLGVKAVASMIAPYPTRGEVGKRAAGSFYMPKLFSARTRKIVRFLSWFG